MNPKCECPLNCRYCGRPRSRDTVGHYCKTPNCQWQYGYSTCDLHERNRSRHSVLSEVAAGSMQGREPETVERWLAVAGFVGYEVSNFGQVRRPTGTRGRGIRQNRILRPSTVNGYPTVWLRCNGKNTARRVHLLVIRTFDGPAPEGMECRHLDGNPLNARLDNLVYGTKEQNEADKIRHDSLRYGRKHYKAKFTDDDIRDIRRRVRAGESQESVAATYGVSQTAISKIHRRVRWPHIEDVP